MRRKFNTIPKLHLKKNDVVKVISGDDKGKVGRIIKVMSKQNRILVEGVNIVIKHTKPTADNTDGGRVEMEAPINLSNVMFYDEKAKKTTRIGRKLVNVKGDQKLVRVSVRTKEEIK